MPVAVGTKLGPYEIVAPLGAGGMGEVYRAHDGILHRDVAIKFLKPESMGNQQAEKRLLREAQSVARLDHPNICTVYEVVTSSEQAFIVMQFVDGDTLKERVTAASGSGAKKGLPIEEVLSIAAQVSDALAEAHRHGIVHRDIKPQNVMLTRAGRVKVLDFGLAKTVLPMSPEEQTRSLLTVPGAVPGTARYMSPEQIRDEDLDARSDVFSLGILLYELLTGEHPFPGSSSGDTISAILTREPPAIRESSPIPLELRELLRKCLEKDKAHRYPSAAEIGVQLATIRTQWDSTEHSVPPGNPPPPPPTLAAPFGSAVFVGRESEQRTMAEAWNRTKNGQRNIILVSGEPGIGKTRLCSEFARSCAGDRATVLIGRSDEQALVAYQPFIEALGWYVRTCSRTDLLSHLGAAGGGAELGLILPDLARRVPGLPAAAPINAEAQRFRLFETVTGFLISISSSHPTLFVFDDLQWADQASLLMLRHLARSSVSARLCILVNYRDSELTNRSLLAEMLAEFRRDSSVTRVTLSGLSEPAVGEIVESLAQRPPDYLVKAVAENSGGNPFFVGEMLRHLVETGAFTILRDTISLRHSDLGVPEGVRDVIRHRLSRLSEDCTRLLTTAAIVGQEFDLVLLESVAGVSEERMLDVIDEAVRAQLIIEAAGDRCRFVHALIRETVYEELSGPRRARMHRKIGEALERIKGNAPPLADLAYHFHEAVTVGTVEKAVEYATRAGDAAAASLAQEEAARFYAMALKSVESAPAGPQTTATRLDLHSRRGRAFTAIGQWAAAKGEFERAVACVDPQMAEVHCELLLGIAEAAFWLGGEVSAVAELASKALALAERIPARPDLVANAMARAAHCAMVSGNIESAVSLNLRAVDTVAGQRTLAYPHGTIALYLTGRSSEAVSLGRKAAELARSSQDLGFIMQALPHLAISLAASGAYREAQEVFAEARQLGKKYGTIAPLARVVAFEAGLHLSLFDYKGAETLQQEARELASSVAFAPAFISSGIDMLLTFARTHNPGAAEGFLDEMSIGAAKHPWHRGLWAVRLSQARAELALSLPEWEKAIVQATAAAAEARKIGRPKYEALALIVRAQARAALHRRDEAIADARGAVALARRTGDPALLLRALDTQLCINGDDDLLAEARSVGIRISEALSDDTMRLRFSDSETMRRILRGQEASRVP